MNLVYDYITSILVYLIPTQRTYNGLPTNTHLLLDPANSLTQPMAITETNVIYDVSPTPCTCLLEPLHSRCPGGASTAGSCHLAGA